MVADAFILVTLVNALITYAVYKVMDLMINELSMGARKQKSKKASAAKCEPS